MFQLQRHSSLPDLEDPIQPAGDETPALAPCSDCPAAAIPLSMAPCDTCVRLVGVQGGRRLRKRLAELGLNPGCTVRVLQSFGGCPLILAVKDDARMAIGRGMAHKIMVMEDEEAAR